MSYLALAKRVEQKLEVREKPSPLPQNNLPLSLTDQTVLAIKMAFPGARALSTQEVQKINAKGYFDPSEWAQDQLSKEGSE